MKDIRYTFSAGIPHGSMADEFLCHKQGPEWWYATSYLNDDAGNLFTFQFTLAKIKIYGIKFNILMTAVTDFQSGVHHYSQQAIFFGKNVIITPERVGVDGTAEMTFGPQKLGLNMVDKTYSLNLELEITKPAAWHADDGTLKMGIDDNWTYYLVVYQPCCLRKTGPGRERVPPGRQGLVRPAGWVVQTDRRPHLMGVVFATIL